MPFVDKAIFDFSWETYQRAILGEFSASQRATIPTVVAVSPQKNYSEVVKYWNNIEGLPEEEALIDVLRILEPRIERVVLKTSPYSVSVRRSGNNFLEPITYFGEGLAQLFALSLSLIQVKHGIVLIDEIESGLHYSIFPKLWEFLFRQCKEQGTTLFATSHSYDVADSFARRALYQKEILGVLTRLDVIGGRIQAVQYTEEEAYLAALDRLEVR
ncbi:MAG: AAA family ATPase [Bryobacter sp.]|nr:AAA family ATPase [Bryobacter sp.]